LVSIVSTTQENVGVSHLRKFISEKELRRLVRELARRTKREIDEAGLTINDFEGIACLYGIKFGWQNLSLDIDGHYLKGDRVIALNRRINHAERQNFSFCHELIHDRIECDDSLFEVLHEFAIDMPDDDMERLIERLCNIGAAELLIPFDELSEVVDQRGFSTELIPELCERFNASSLAVAFKLISIASHSCYLVIAEKRKIAINKNQPIMLQIDSNQDWHLWVVYSGNSPSAKYTTGRNTPVLTGHLMYKALDNEREMVHGKDDIPRHNSINRRWEMNCDCLAYKGWVFGFFHETQPVSPDQPSLL
jgi:Zn-dependent peptidase ImmA (M78 family)